MISGPMPSPAKSAMCSHLAHPIAAIDVVGLGDDIVGTFLAKRRPSLSNLVGPSGHRGRLHQLPLFLAFWFVFIFCEECVDIPVVAINHARGDGIHVDLVGIKFKPADCVSEMTAALVAQ